jgi:hypothetical protein
MLVQQGVSAEEGEPHAQRSSKELLACGLTPDESTRAREEENQEADIN